MNPGNRSSCFSDVVAFLDPEFSPPPLTSQSKTMNEKRKNERTASDVVMNSESSRFSCFPGGDSVVAYLDPDYSPPSPSSRYFITQTINSKCSSGENEKASGSSSSSSLCFADRAAAVVACLDPEYLPPPPGSQFIKKKNERTTRGERTANSGSSPSSSSYFSDVVACLDPYDSPPPQQPQQPQGSAVSKRYSTFLPQASTSGRVCSMLLAQNSSFCFSNVALCLDPEFGVVENQTTTLKHQQQQTGVEQEVAPLEQGSVLYHKPSILQHQSSLAATTTSTNTSGSTLKDVVNYIFYPKRISEHTAVYVEHPQQVEVLRIIRMVHPPGKTTTTSTKTGGEGSGASSSDLVVEQQQHLYPMVEVDYDGKNSWIFSATPATEQEPAVVSIVEDEKQKTKIQSLVTRWRKSGGSRRRNRNPSSSASFDGFSSSNRSVGNSTIMTASRSSSGRRQKQYKNNNNLNQHHEKAEVSSNYSVHTPVTVAADEDFLEGTRSSPPPMCTSSPRSVEANVEPAHSNPPSSSSSSRPPVTRRPKPSPYRRADSEPASSSVLEHTNMGILSVTRPVSEPRTIAPPPCNEASVYKNCLVDNHRWKSLFRQQQQQHKRGNHQTSLTYLVTSEAPDGTTGASVTGTAAGKADHQFRGVDDELDDAYAGTGSKSCLRTLRMNHIPTDIYIDMGAHIETREAF